MCYHEFVYPALIGQFTRAHFDRKARVFKDRTEGVKVCLVFDLPPDEGERFRSFSRHDEPVRTFVHTKRNFLPTTRDVLHAE